MATSTKPAVQAFFDEPTNTVSYLVADPATKKAIIIDPVLDYDHDAGTVDTRSVESGLSTLARVRLSANLSNLEEVWVRLP